MRYFQKAIRRAGIPVSFSQGYHPHQLLTFASPLGVGMESSGEYLDIEVEECSFYHFSVSLYMLMSVLYAENGKCSPSTIMCAFR